jgi:hypothetical protein
MLCAHSDDEKQISVMLKIESSEHVLNDSCKYSSFVTDNKYDIGSVGNQHSSADSVGSILS